MNKTKKTERYPFDAIIDMCFRLGVRNISDLPGCWEHVINEHWWVAVNGQVSDTFALSPTDREYHRTGTMVPPFTAYLEFNGWPAGFVDPQQGMMAAGAAANAETFIAACDAVGV